MKRECRDKRTAPVNVKVIKKKEMTEEWKGVEWNDCGLRVSA